MKHGLFSKQTVAESVDRLGEDKTEFARHLRFFERVFIPGDEEERRIVRGLGEAVWRRLRLFRAQAGWEIERLQRIFAKAPAPAQLSVDDTVARADGLTLALMEFEAFYRELSKIESQVEFWLRELIRKRSHGAFRWRGFSPRRDPLIERIEKEEQVSRFVEYWDALSPEEQTAALDEARKKASAEMAGREREQETGD